MKVRFKYTVSFEYEGDDSHYDSPLPAEMAREAEEDFMRNSVDELLEVAKNVEHRVEVIWVERGELLG